MAGRFLDKLLVRGKHVCPSWLCFTFDNPLRRIFHDPDKIIAPYISPGVTVLDIGPGQGYFTIPMCRLVGGEGRVIAVDIQEKMLKAVQRRAAAAGMAGRLTTHLSRADDFDLTEPADFILAFWMVHEVPEPRLFLARVKGLMKPAALFLIAEPLFHVTKGRFEHTLTIAQELGFKIAARPQISFSYAAALVL